MFSLKYYDKIKRAQGEPVPLGPGAAPEFDFDKGDSLRERLTASVVNAVIDAALWFFRVFWPNPRLGRLVIVTRAKDVCQTLKNQDAFQVPFGLEVVDLGGANTVLGMDDCPHHMLRDQIDVLIDREKDGARVRADTRQVASALIANARGRLDVAGDLITRCATESCARYFGLQVDNPVAFADWAMAMSRLLFADPTGKGSTREQALYASRRLQAIARCAMADAARNAGRPGAPDTLAQRLHTAKQTNPALTDDVILSTLVATTTGYIPTTALAAAKMLEALYRRPAAWRQARAAAKNNRPEEMTRILMEAGRLNPALYPGQWRYARTAGVIAEGTLRQRKVRKGDVLLVATGAALADGRQYPSPRAFRPDREQQPDLLFGYASHRCLGDFIAWAMLTEVFMQLMALDDLRPAPDKLGKLRRAGAFPRQWDWVFTPPDGMPPRVQSMSVVCVPIATRGERDVDARIEAEIREAVSRLGNPVTGPLHDALARTKVIHFASLTVSDLGEADKPAPHLLLEINADGAPEVGLNAVASAARDEMAPIFARALGDETTDFATILTTHNLASHAKPWSTTHLGYNGIEELPVTDIDQQDGLAQLCRRATDFLARRRPGMRPIERLRLIRGLIRGHPDLQDFVRNDLELADLAGEAEAFRVFITQPARRTLKLADWVDISINQARLRTLLSEDARPIRLALLGLWAALTVILFLATGGWRLSIDAHAAQVALSFRPPTWTTLPGRLLLSGIVALVGALLIPAGGLAGALLYLRHKEKTDPVDTRHVDFAHLQACTANENPPGYAHNHFVATPTLKKGLFRRFVLAGALWGIGTLIKYGFRPGFVLDMGTIHYAKWFRPPGSRRLVFYGNYDGSWESYLEDFITKAHWGQTAGWSNCEGFPPTKLLINGGAEDGDRFKRWVRRQQIPTGFWFSRFPHLTTERIRGNALIHHGLTHAHTDSAARAWLACFGSQQRNESTLETDDIQSVVFQGFGGLDQALCAVLTLPDKPADCASWLDLLLKTDYPPGAPRPRTPVTFGDAPGRQTRESAITVAFSASGLRKLGLPDGEDDAGDGLATFPGVFRMGMSNRARTLGDDGCDAPTRWRWADVGQGVAERSDAVLIIYAKEPEDCQAILDEHLALLGQDAKRYVLPLQPAVGGDLRSEHFGFRDAISQPVIRGTERFAKQVNANDVLEPGEFILGYPTNQGYFPPSPLVHADTDGECNLATAQAESPKRFPMFGEGPRGASFHDFGRNGSFLVLRQFEQHVGSLHSFADTAAEALGETYPDLRLRIGDNLSAGWIKAKLVGRWPNGVSLLDRPNFPGNPPDEENSLDNSFAFGRDDPQGLRCPLGAHGRRANPRDSLDPSDPHAREIANRHRLLRRGRSYSVPNDQGGTEHGLLFACLCADLERQFEFVQQTWINAPSFHGLNGEADPLLRGHKTPAYTIPTLNGPVQLPLNQRFVTVKGGGYYFLPSRSALSYLRTRCNAAPRDKEKALEQGTRGPAPLGVCPHTKPVPLLLEPDRA